MLYPRVFDTSNLHLAHRHISLPSSSPQRTQVAQTTTPFECPSHYILQKPIGKGAYGIVVSAIDSNTGLPIAIKKVNNIFQHEIDARRALLEVKILRHLNPIIPHDTFNTTTINTNIVSLKDCFPGLTTTTTNNNNNIHNHHKMTYTDLYLGYNPLCDTDLHQMIRSPQQLSTEHIKFFLYQLLRGIKYLHSADIVHRDLKPSNLLVNGNCDLVICDLGLAASASSTSIKNDKLANTGEYVVTRWYRAPELLISCGRYTKAADIYSVGCIFAEMLGRKPLFPGKDYLHQLNLIFKVIGTPTTINNTTTDNNQILKRYLASSVPYQPPAQLDRIFPHAPPAALDLLSRMLSFHPEHRPTAEQALQHPFLSSLHDQSDEPCCPKGVFNKEGFDYLGATMGQVREELWKEMCWYNPQLDNFIIS